MIEVCALNAISAVPPAVDRVEINALNARKIGNWLAVNVILNVPRVSLNPNLDARNVIITARPAQVSAMRTGSSQKREKGEGGFSVASLL